MHSSTRLAAALLIAGAACAVPVGAAQAADTTGTVHIDIGGPLRMADEKPAPAIGRAIIGANARWVDDELGAWDPVAGAPSAGFDAAATAAGLDMVRYPGGTVANFFDFKAAIGPDAQRGCQTSGGFAAVRFGNLTPDENRFGPDEEQQLVASFGGETMIMVPSINETAQDAADFVEYMNSPADGGRTNPNGGVDWAEVRAANGHPAPYGIQYWEYGNEPYNAGQRYWRADDMTTRAHEFVYGGWERQSAQSTSYQDNDGLFSGCDLADRQSGTGQSNQQYRTRYRPVALASDTTAESGPIADPVLTVAGTAWTRVDDLATAGPEDTVYQLDRSGGVVRFGDGVHGAIPPAGAQLSIEYTTGRQDGLLDFQAAMKAVDPNIKVCAGWAQQVFVDAMGSHPYDCLGVHSYTQPVAGDAQGAYSTDQLYDQLMTLSGQPTTELGDLRRQLAGYFPDPAHRPDLVVTEYGTINQAGPTGAAMPANFGAMLMHNLYESSLLVGQMNNGVRLSINSNLNAQAAARPANRSWAEMLASPPGFLATGRAVALSLATTMVGGAPRSTSLAGNPDTAQHYPALVAAATCTAGTVRVLVVNRDRTSDVPVVVNPPRAGVSQLRLTTVTADEINAYNTQTATPVQRTTTTTPVNGRSVSTVLPAHSTDLIEVTMHGDDDC